jgi:hypothetical protein
MTPKFASKQHGAATGNRKPDLTMNVAVDLTNPLTYL